MIKLGPCSLKYGTGENVVTIDKTSGGVNLKIEPIKSETKIDQYGDGVYDHIITGYNVVAEVPVADTQNEMLKGVMVFLEEVVDGADSTKKKLVDRKLGTSMRQLAKPLVLHPLENDEDDLSDDITLRLAAIENEVELGYNSENIRVMQSNFRAYPVGPAVNKENYFSIGDPTAVAVPSSANDLLDTVYGSLTGTPVTGVTGVLDGIKVLDFKNGLTVSEHATIEILASTGGAPVVNQQTTNLTATMVIQVTSQSGDAVEYTIAMAV